VAVLHSAFRSRRSVVLLTLGLLLLLDVARSAYARVGYAQPVETWQPDPAVYADVAWPPGADLPADTPTGQRLYVQHCAVCHGPDGRGNGPAAPSLIPHPRDFTLGQFKYMSGPPGQPPSDADLTRVISGGLQASAMPGFGDLLSEDDIRMLVGVVKSFSLVFNQPAPQPLAIPPRISADQASLARGAQLFTTQGCAGCHGADGRARLTLPDARGYPVVARDLTAAGVSRKTSGCA
jgi:mono/diheme cytochrome c family protein